MDKMDKKVTSKFDSPRKEGQCKPIKKIESKFGSPRKIK